MQEKQNKHNLLKYLTIGIILIVVYKLLDNFSNVSLWFINFLSVLMPFLLAGLVAYILYIPCKSIEKTFIETNKKFLIKRARGLSIFIVYLLVFTFIFMVINFIIPSLTESIKDLAESVPGFYKNTKEYFYNLPEDSIFRKINIDQIIENLQKVNISETVISWLSFENITHYAKGVVGFAGGIFDVFVIVVVSIYLLKERRKIKEFVKDFSKAVFDDDTNKNLSKYYKRANKVFSSFISSQVLDAFVVGIVVTIILLILKVKYAVMLGFLIGIFNVIPYLGAIIAVFIAGIITLFTGGITKALLMLVLVIILQQIDANIINPKILGTSLEISPILIIFSVTVLGAYFGILGMFLAVPIAAMIKVLLLDFIEERNKNKNKNKE